MNVIKGIGKVALGAFGVVLALSMSDHYASKAADGICDIFGLNKDEDKKTESKPAEAAASATTEANS